MPGPNTGRGRGGSSRRGGGRGRNYNSNINHKSFKTGLNKDLEGHIFDYGMKTSADLMRTTRKKIVRYVGSKYSGDIANELMNQTPLVIDPPEYSNDVKLINEQRLRIICAQQANTMSAYREKLDVMTRNIVSNPTDADMILKQAR